VLSIHMTDGQLQDKSDSPDNCNPKQPVDISLGPREVETDLFSIILTNGSKIQLMKNVLKFNHVVHEPLLLLPSMKRVNKVKNFGLNQLFNINLLAYHVSDDSNSVYISEKRPFRSLFVMTIIFLEQLLFVRENE
jgi:hypothetical protein